jgi:S-adenosyl-L-methionine hydrolase (adenosine-forming)
MNTFLSTGATLSTITLLTDFGLVDGYVGSMKGVIWQIAPNAQIADITHNIPPQDVFTGSYLLARSGIYFPANTVHIAVVDPGVGTERRPIAAQIGNQYFVGPDNGLVSFLLQLAIENDQPYRFVHTNQKKYWLEKVSFVFHGRDIFSPIGAHLSNGVPLEELGDVISDPILLDIPQAKAAQHKISGNVLQIDHFGNITTNIHVKLLAGHEVKHIQYKNIDFGTLSKSFGEKEPGEWVATIDSFEYLSLSIVNGNAAEKLNASIHDVVEVIF